MTSRLLALTFDAQDPQRVAHFWARFLDREEVREPDGGIALPSRGWGGRGDPGDGAGFDLRFVPSAEPRRGPNPWHFNLTSDSLDDQQDKVARALELGARHLDIGQGPDATHVVLADPGGNEFCVIQPGNKWLAECGFIGDVAGDGSPETGYFWSRALDWPLVWDQDGETAIRSPLGGPKITWGGPPLAPKAGKDRVHLDLAPLPGGDLRAEAERLISLGAHPVDIGQKDVGWVVLADPDGHEFCLLPSARE